jgi:hypothetical protein
MRHGQEKTEPIFGSESTRVAQFFHKPIRDAVCEILCAIRGKSTKSATFPQA